MIIIRISLFLISDSTGETVEQISKAAISQFDIKETSMKKFINVRDIYFLNKIFEEEVKDSENPIIFYTLVNEKLLDFTHDFCEQYNIPHVDILTPSILALEKMTKLEPKTKPGALRKLDDKYFKRVEAIEFAVRYDDGKDPRGILLADIVLIGVSRTSKTPLSMYLANKKYKVANVPLVPSSNPPKEIFKVSSSKVIGLTNSPEKLNQIRKERIKSMGFTLNSSYADLNNILEELEYAHCIMKKIGCPVIDVSNRAIEETAEIIIKYLNKKIN